MAVIMGVAAVIAFVGLQRPAHRAVVAPEPEPEPEPAAV
jgi:hypothetical protein